MNFQEHCNQYIQRINQTRSIQEANPELSLQSHLQEFLEDVTTDVRFRENLDNFILTNYVDFEIIPTPNGV